jgi:hypothetical protein
MPPRWPLPPIHLVMENATGSCDYYRSHKPCCKISGLATARGLFLEDLVERPVREVLISFLSGCSTRPGGCSAADFGGNNGWMSMIMLALGANVTSVEPASDFAEAIHLSGRLNCWSHRHVVLNAFACEKEEPRFLPRGCMRPRRAWNGYRADGGAPDGLKDRLTDTYGRTAKQILAGARLQAPPHGLLVRGAAVNDLVVESSSRPSAALVQHLPPRHWDLIKLDGDGPEGGWLRAIDRMLVARRISVGAITLEGNNLDAVTMMRFQHTHGFDIYRLSFDERRRITPIGWDALSPEGVPMASLRRATRLGDETVYKLRRPPPRDALETEVFGLRAMRHLYKAKDGLNETEWGVLLGGIWNPRRHAHQWLLTTDKNLAEPVPSFRRGQPWIKLEQ